MTVRGLLKAAPEPFQQLQQQHGSDKVIGDDSLLRNVLSFFVDYYEFIGQLILSFMNLPTAIKILGVSIAVIAFAYLFYKCRSSFIKTTALPLYQPKRRIKMQ